MRTHPPRFPFHCMDRHESLAPWMYFNALYSQTRFGNLAPVDDG